jgi:hypothetical protein
VFKIRHCINIYSHINILDTVYFGNFTKFIFGYDKGPMPHSETRVLKIPAFSVPYTQIGESIKRMLFSCANETIAFSTINTDCTRFLSYVV